MENNLRFILHIGNWIYKDKIFKRKIVRYIRLWIIDTQRKLKNTAGKINYLLMISDITGLEKRKIMMKM